jgi:putative transposon-encoded protein
MYIEIKGYDSIEKVVRAYGKSGALSVPKIWVKGQVQVININDENYEKDFTQGKRKKTTEIPTEKKLYKIYGSESIKKTVVKGSRVGMIYLQQKWIGSRVKVVLLENPLKEDG